MRFWVCIILEVGSQLETCNRFCGCYYAIGNPYKLIISPSFKAMMNHFFPKLWYSKLNLTVCVWHQEKFYFCSSLFIDDVSTVCIIIMISLYTGSS
jgi:hypothetical protein